MKTIGVDYGMSWESTVSYYQIINEEVKRRLMDFILQRLFFTVWNLTRSKNVSQTATGKEW